MTQPLRLTLFGDPRTKKNSARIITRPYPRMLPSKQYVQYESDCLNQLRWFIPPGIAEPVNLCCVYYMRTRRTVDLANLIEATCDILVKAGWLKDDNSAIVAGHDGSGVRYDRGNPRAEILITPMEVEP